MKTQQSCREAGLVRRRAVRVAVMVAVAIAASACGGGTDGDLAGVPSATQTGDGTAGSATSTGSSTSTTNPSADMFAWAACMRDHGIPYSDPDPEIGKPILDVPEDGKDDPTSAGVDDAAMSAAEDACREFAGWPLEAPDPGLQAERDELLLEWAQCMRDQGVEIADDPVDGGGRDPNATPTDGPAQGDYAAAEEACRDVAEGGDNR